MPLVRIFHPEGVDGDAASKGVRDALGSAFGIPPDDLFHVITDTSAATRMVRPQSYLGMDYSDGFLVVQITCSAGRTVEQKKALYAAIVSNLERLAGVRPDDVMINLVEVAKENWSFGRGVAQYA